MLDQWRTSPATEAIELLETRVRAECGDHRRPRDHSKFVRSQQYRPVRWEQIRVRQRKLRSRWMKPGSASSAKSKLARGRRNGGGGSNATPYSASLCRSACFRQQQTSFCPCCKHTFLRTFSTIMETGLDHALVLPPLSEDWFKPIRSGF